VKHDAPHRVLWFDDDPAVKTPNPYKHTKPKISAYLRVSKYYPIRSNGNPSI